MASVLIVADIQLLLEGLREIVVRQGDYQVVGCEPDVDSALAAIEKLRPDLVLLDLATPSSLSFVQGVNRRFHGTRVVVIGLPHNDSDLIRCAEAGVSAYVARDQSSERLHAAMRCASVGELQCSPHDAAVLLRQVSALAADRLSDEVPELTPREEQVAQLFHHGLSNKEIARQLGIEVPTVKNHVHSILEKLHVHRKAEAARRLRSRFLPTPDRVKEALADEV